MIAGARIEVDERKKNPLDFACGKIKRRGTILGEPLGEGRPGWHIECTAMSMKHLGKVSIFTEGVLICSFPS